MLLLMPPAADPAGGIRDQPLAALPPSAARAPAAKPLTRQTVASQQASSSAAAGQDVLWTRQGCVESSLQQVRANLQT